MNKPDKKVSLAVWSLVLAVFTLVAFHVPFFRHLSANVEAGTNGIVIAVTAALLLLVLDFLLYYVLAWLLRFVGKCIVAFTLFGDAVMLYFVNNYDVLVTDEMMGNVFRTQYSEASGFFSFSFILYILGGPPRARVREHEELALDRPQLHGTRQPPDAVVLHRQFLPLPGCREAEERPGNPVAGRGADGRQPGRVHPRHRRVRPAGPFLPVRLSQGNESVYGEGYGQGLCGGRLGHLYRRRRESHPGALRG